MKPAFEFVLLFAAAAHAFPSTFGPPSTTFQPEDRTGSWPSSTGGYSTGGYSTGGYSTGGYSTGGYSTDGYSTGGYSTGGYSDRSWPSSTGGYSTTFQPAVARKVGRFGVKESQRYYPSWLSTTGGYSTTFQPAVAKKVGRFGLPEARMVDRFGNQEESERYYPSSTWEPSSTTYQP